MKLVGELGVSYGREIGRQREREVVREVSYGGISLWSLGKQGYVLFCLYPPTLEEASVRELRVLDLPALGLPTRPMRGSRGMVDVCQIW